MSDGRRALALIAAVAISAGTARADAPAAATATATSPGGAAHLGTQRRLGRLEQESLTDALTELGLKVEPAPEGKTIREIYAVNQDVFSKRDWFMPIFNIFHRTTRPEHLRRELLFHPGERYDPALIEESIRYLQQPPSIVIANRTTISQPELSSVVAIVPVVSPVAGTVDVLAVTRDVWSLRFNTNFEFQQNALTLLDASLSENNLFGWRKYLAVAFDMDQGRYGFGPSYFDPNVLGTRLTLVAQATTWSSRETGAHEGDSEIVSLRYPLYSLASRWGAGVDVTHQDTVTRSFLGNHLRPEDLTKTPDVVEAIPYEFRRRILTTDVNVLRSFSGGRDGTVIQRVIAGHRYDRRRSLVLDDFPVDPNNPQLAQDFLNEWAPQSESRSGPYLRYEVFTARYAELRDLDTFDLRENRLLGPSMKVEVGADVPALGADFAAVSLGAVATWAVASGAGDYSYAQVQVSGRRGHGDFIDEHLATSVYVAAPPIARAVRLVMYAHTDAVKNDTHRTLFFLGGSTGLRGYAIGDFQGSTEAVAHVELRSVPIAVFSQRLGALAFYDVGHAASSFGALSPHHDAGVGLRWLFPQANSTVIRADWAVAMQDGTLTRAGLPGRFSAGFLQAF